MHIVSFIASSHSSGYNRYGCSLTSFASVTSTLLQAANFTLTHKNTHLHTLSLVLPSYCVSKILNVTTLRLHSTGFLVL